MDLIVASGEKTFNWGTAGVRVEGAESGAEGVFAAGEQADADDAHDIRVDLQLAHGHHRGDEQDQSREQVAERDLAAQNARVGLATANLYPSFRLTGSVSSSSTNFSGLFDSSAVTTSLVRGISAPIFNFGQLRANVEAEDALYEQSLSVYKKTILNALREVEDALAARTAAAKSASSLQDAVEAATSVRDLATQEYEAGLSGFIEVLDAQRTLLSLQEQHALNRSAETGAMISLYKAAGGGWSAAPQDTDSNGENS